MKAFTFLTIFFLLAGVAMAGGVSKGYLTRVDDGPDPDARGLVKVKSSPGGDIFSVKLKKVDPEATYWLYLQKAPDSLEWIELGKVIGRKKWKINTARGDTLPDGVKSLEDIAGLRLVVKVEVDEGDDEAILTGVVPDVTAKGKFHKGKARLAAADDSKAAGDIQLDGTTLRVKVHKAAAGDYDVFIEDDDEEMQDVGDLSVGSNGSGQWTICTKKGDTIPFDCAALTDLCERKLEVRNEGDDVVFDGTIPGEKAKPATGNSGNGPRLRILVTDAPFPFENVKSAVVSVKRIEIRKVGSPFATLLEWENGRDLDLVKLKNGVMNILYAGDPEPGDYDALRIIVEPKEITIVDGGQEKTFTEFKVPSGSQTGIKVFVKPVVEVVTDLTKDILLDMDLEKSFIVQGNPKTPAGIKGFHFKPVVRAVNKTVAGTLTFRLMSDNGTPRDRTDDFYLDGAAYRVTDATPETIASGASGKDPADARTSGYVFHPGVLAGTYLLTVEYRYHDAHEQRVTLYAGNLTDEGTIVLKATAAYIKGNVTTSLTTVDGDTVSFIVVGATVSGALSTDATTTASDTTNSMGDYALTALDFGTWNVKASMTGYVDGTGSSVAWVPGDPTATDLDLELVPSTAGLTGTVTDESDVAVSGATVKVVFTLLRTDYVIASTTTDVDGNYSFTDLATGGFEVRASYVSGDTTTTGTASVTHVGPTASTADITLE